jgi:mannitol-1-phosphate 5-dehydrogenase
MADREPAAPVAVQIGAGKIGRGLMGELFFASGYQTVFVDIDRPLVEALRARGSYDVHHVANEGSTPAHVANFSALDANNIETVAEAIAGAALVCTAVGARNLPDVAPSIARGLAVRLRRGAAAPLNIIACENLVGAGQRLGDRVWSEFTNLSNQDRGATGGTACGMARPEFDARFGFVGAVVSRTVPAPPEEIRRRDPLWLACETVSRLRVDAAAFRGPVPRVIDMDPVANFVAYEQQKLVSHNMSHTVAAYLGYQAGCEFIWQAIADASIAGAVRGAMDETGRALVSRFGFDPAEQRAYEEDLLRRYGNRALGDQVRRVAADPVRKLGPQDRLIGSARLCFEEGVDPRFVVAGIQAALAYHNTDDAGAVRLQEMLSSRGREAVLRDVCGLSPGEPLYGRLRE